MTGIGDAVNVKRERGGVDVRLFYPVALAMFLALPFFTTFTRFIPSRFFWIAMTLGCVMLIVISAVPKNFKVIINEQIILWLLFFIFTLYNNYDIKEGEYFKTVYLFLLFAAMFFLSSDSAWHKAFYNIVLLCMFVHAAATLLFFVVPGAYHYYYALLRNARVVISMPNANYQAGLTTHYSLNSIYLSMGFLVAAIKKITNKKTPLIFVLIYAFALILTTKRGPFLFAAVTTCVIYVACGATKGTTKLIKLIVILLVVIAAFLLISRYIPELLFVIDRFIIQDNLTNNRLPLYTMVRELFYNKPAIGQGWGSFRHIYFERYGAVAYTPYLDAHNVYLQLLAELGIIGLALFLLVSMSTVVGTVRLAQRFRKEGKDAFAITASAGIQIFFLLYCITENPLYDMYTVFPYLLSCAVYYSLQIGLTARGKVGKGNA